MNNTLVMGNTAVGVDVGGVEYRDSDFVTVSNSQFIGNSAGRDAGGLHLVSAQVNLAEPFSSVVGPNVEFRNNSAGRDGGGLRANFNSGGTFIGPNVLFEGNRAEDFGSGYGDLNEFDNTTFKGSNVVFRNNSAGSLGGALFSLFRNPVTASPDAKLTIDDVVFENNSTDPSTGLGDFNDGGAMFVIFGTVDVLNSRFMNNKSGSDGGVANLIECDAAGVIDNNHFEGNTAGNDGGALWTNCELTITDNTMKNSMANVGPISFSSSGGGGALSLTGSFDYVVNDNLFEDNQTLGSVDDPTSLGGAILMDGLFSGGMPVITELERNTFRSNKDSPAGILTGNHIACQGDGDVDTSVGTNTFIDPVLATAFRGCPSQ